MSQWRPSPDEERWLAVASELGAAVPHAALAERTGGWRSTGLLARIALFGLGFVAAVLLFGVLGFGSETMLLVAGVIANHAPGRVEPEDLFELSPLPNWCFQRDPQVVLGSGVVFGSMAAEARHREALLARAAWGDYDNDGDLDLFHYGDAWPGGYPSSRLYRNEGGTNFVRVGTNLPESVDRGSAIWGDYDNDGDLDLLVTGLSLPRIATLYRNESTIPNNPPWPRPDYLREWILRASPSTGIRPATIIRHLRA